MYAKNNNNSNFRKSLTSSQHPYLLNSPNFPDIEFKQSKPSLNKSYMEDNREKMNISKFTLGENFEESLYSSKGLKIEDLKTKKNHSFRYNNEKLPFSKLSLKDKQLFKQKIEENNIETHSELEKDIENMGVGYQNILNNQKFQNNQFNQKVYKVPQKNNESHQFKQYDNMSIQTFNTEALSFESENKDSEPIMMNQKFSNNYTKIFIPVSFDSP